ncbi:archease [Candidatus Peregrinibacteria bacterium]|nr:archease [Candidatus Peregrinibacteria bacterium]
MKKYEFHPEIKGVDKAFYAYGKTYGELFENACLAMTNAMLDLETVEPKIKERLTVKAPYVEELLANVLAEIVFLKDTKQLVFNFFDVRDFKNKPNGCEVTLVMKGEKMDHKKHHIRWEVKEVSYLNYGIQKTKEGYQAAMAVDLSIH